MSSFSFTLQSRHTTPVPSGAAVPTPVPTQHSGEWMLPVMLSARPTWSRPAGDLSRGPYLFPGVERARGWVNPGPTLSSAKQGGPEQDTLLSSPGRFYLTWVAPGDLGVGDTFSSEIGEHKTGERPQ